MYHVEPGYCNCERCNTVRKEKMQVIEEIKQEIISNSLYPDKIQENCLNELDRFYLSILIRSGLDENIEQSQMSSFLFNYILKIDDLGYSHKPIIDI